MLQRIRMGSRRKFNFFPIVIFFSIVIKKTCELLPRFLVPPRFLVFFQKTHPGNAKKRGPGRGGGVTVLHEHDAVTHTRVVILFDFLEVDEGSGGGGGAEDDAALHGGRYLRGLDKHIVRRALCFRKEPLRLEPV